MKNQEHVQIQLISFHHQHMVFFVDLHARMISNVHMYRSAVSQPSVERHVKIHQIQRFVIKQNFSQRFSQYLEMKVKDIHRSVIQRMDSLRQNNVQIMDLYVGAQILRMVTKSKEQSVLQKPYNVII
jgi:hypothetical protein